MTVLQKWLEAIPLRMQSTLVLSLRGPDTHRCPEIKKVQRWMRGLVFVPGNPDNVNEFMAPLSEVPALVEKGPLARELEFTTQHFYSHLMHGLEVITYKHPDADTAVKASELCWGMCDLLHLQMETPEGMQERLGTRTDWKDGRQPKSFEDVEDPVTVAEPHVCDGCPKALDDCFPETMGTFCSIKAGVLERERNR